MHTGKRRVRKEKGKIRKKIKVQGKGWKRKENIHEKGE